MSSVPHKCLLFSGSHFVLQLPVRTYGDVNMQLCMLTPCVSHVEVCTVKRGSCTVSWIYGRSSGSHESPFRPPCCCRGRDCSCFCVSCRFNVKNLCKSFLFKISCKIEALEMHSSHVTTGLYNDIHPKNLLQHNKQGMYYVCGM